MKSLILTNEYLEELKRRGAYNSWDMRRLLARLTSSEKVIQAHIDLENDLIGYDQFVEKLNDWRKIAGIKK